MRVLKSAGVELSGIDAVSAGFAFSIAHDTAGKVWAWGVQTNGRCGTGVASGYAAFATPVKVDATVDPAKPDLGNIAQVAAGQFFCLAAEPRITEGTGRLWAWGYNTDGPLGDGTVTQRNAAVWVRKTVGGGQFDNVTTLAVGDIHATAVVRSATENDTVWCWGAQANGRLGNGLTAALDVKIPIRLNLPSGNPLTGIIAVACGAKHTLALDSQGRVWSWGFNGAQQIGRTASASFPAERPALITAIPASVRIVEVGADNDNSFAIADSGVVYAWGANANAQLGSNTTATAQVTGLVQDRFPTGSPYAGQVKNFVISEDLDDYDLDGLGNGREREAGSNLNVVDTDGDTLSDADEVLIYGTDPTRADTDGDGLPDGWEVAYETNPLLNDAALDADGDGRSTLQEFQSGSDPRDYFNAIVPVFIVEGNNQSGLKGTVLPIPLVVEVHRPGTVAGTVGDAFVNAPVNFSNGGGGLFSTQPDGGFATTLSARTDATGRVPVYFQLPDVHGAYLSPQARATASAMVQFSESTFPKLAPPVFSPEGADRFFGGVKVTGAGFIHYTADGSEPDENSPVVVGQYVDQLGGFTLKAKAFQTGAVPSDTHAAAFRFDIPGHGLVYWGRDGAAGGPIDPIGAGNSVVCAQPPQVQPGTTPQFQNTPWPRDSFASYLVPGLSANAPRPPLDLNPGLRFDENDFLGPAKGPSPTYTLRPLAGMGTGAAAATSFVVASVEPIEGSYKRSIFADGLSVQANVGFSTDHKLALGYDPAQNLPAMRRAGAQNSKTDQLYLLSILNNGTTTDHYRNGFLEGTAPTKIGLSPSYLFFGVRDTQGFWGTYQGVAFWGGAPLTYPCFRIAETLLYNRALSTAERKAVEDYLTQRHGLGNLINDTDGDGLPDWREAEIGTDPFKTDTDGDGLSDRDEVVKYQTNPLILDTDGDYVSDGQEIALGTDPANASSNGNGDTDGDGTSDRNEQVAGTDPRDPASKPAPETHLTFHVTVQDADLKDDVWTVEFHEVAADGTLGPGRIVVTNDQPTVIAAADVPIRIGTRFRFTLRRKPANQQAGTDEYTVSFAPTGPLPKNVLFIEEPTPANSSLTDSLAYGSDGSAPDTSALKWGFYLLPVEFEVTKWEPIIAQPLDPYTTPWQNRPPPENRQSDEAFVGHKTAIDKDTFVLNAEVKLKPLPLPPAQLARVASEWKVAILQNVVEYPTVNSETYIGELGGAGTWYADLSPIPGMDSAGVSDPDEYFDHKRFVTGTEILSLVHKDTPQAGSVFGGIRLYYNAASPSSAVSLSSVRRDVIFVTWVYAEHVPSKARQFLKWIKWRAGWDVDFNGNDFAPPKILKKKYVFQKIGEGEGEGPVHASFDLLNIGYRFVPDP